MRISSLSIIGLLTAGLFSACQDDEGHFDFSEPQQTIKATFQLYAHGTSNTINEDSEREDFVENVWMVGAGVSTGTGQGITFQIPSFQGKKDLFFAANVEGPVASYTEFNTKRYQSQDYVAKKQVGVPENNLKLPMTGVLRAVSSREGVLYQGTKVLTNSPLQLHRVFAKTIVDFKQRGGVTFAEYPNLKLEICNVPKFFTLGGAINNYDLLPEADKYIKVDITDLVKMGEPVEVYLPEHRVSNPDFEHPDANGMTYLRIYDDKHSLKVRIGNPNISLSGYGQIYRNTTYKVSLALDKERWKNSDSEFVN